MSFEIRAISSEEIEDFIVAMGGPFAFDLPESEEERAKRLERFSSLFEPERSRCAFDGDQMVGTLGAFSFDMTVPGGSVKCAGTTMVTVNATHRRRGVLRQMMDAHLAEAREREDPIAALWASDAAIYGRFGFGMAAPSVNWEIDRRHVDLHRLAPAGAETRSVDGAAAAEILPAVYDAVLPTRPGMYARTPTWWKNRILQDSPEWRDGATAHRFVVARDADGRPTGYAKFRVKEGWKDHHGAHEVRLLELMATDAAAHVGLLEVVMSHDLATKITAWDRPADDPVFDLLASARRLKARVTDGLWVLLLDVPAALAARRYSDAGTFVIEVADPTSGNSSRWLFETDGSETDCSVTSRAPDLALDMEDLGAAYLGRARLSELVRVGRVEASIEVARSFDRVFGWDPQPWCPEVF